MMSRGMTSRGRAFGGRMTIRTLLFALAASTPLAFLTTTDARAQQPYPRPQPYAPQPYAPQPYAPQPSPQPQPYPAPPPYPQTYPQPTPGYVSSPPSATVATATSTWDAKRGYNELLFLYGAGIGYGVGTGIWIDALANVTDPGIAFIAPLALGVAMPIGVYFLDDNVTLHRGVPSSIATGLALGAVEGMAISSTQWELSDHGNAWSFKTDATVTWLIATGGAVGGYAFGEWLRPDPRKLSFIASGAAWGAISGSFLGAGIVSSKNNWDNGASIWGLVGYNAGIVATGALATVYTPSYETQKWMWIGYAAGTAAGCVVYPFYLLAPDAPVHHGLIANALGGLGGLALAAAFAGTMSDEPGHAKNFSPPVNVAVTPAPPAAPGAAMRGAMLSAYGQW
jgi:hypothetical protein